MATYVPNVSQYLPELKTFTPDYKFLSDVLQTRQSKYNTNYKQLNNAYSKIIYSDLSREDTNATREQFVNDLQPTLEKISGLDLSLAQNVNAAQAVFDPFYSDDLILKDMVYTKNFKDNIKKAEMLMTSPDKDMQGKYWKEGIEFMSIKMDDFKNASREGALGMRLESYVENPQLYKRAMDYLNEKKYKMKYDELSENNDFIVTNVNGENVTASFMADLKMMFSKDPMINRAYYTKSYVDSRNYANDQINQGLVGSIDEGVSNYNIGKIETLKKSQEAKVVSYDEKITTLESALTEINDTLKDGKSKPGSTQDLMIKKINDEIDGAKNKEKCF